MLDLSARMNLNEASSPYLQLMSQSDNVVDNVSMAMKSEEDHDYSTSNFPFTPNDCSYFAQQNHSPHESFNSMQSPTNFSNSNTLFNTVSCTPNIQALPNPLQQALVSRPRINSYLQTPRLPMGGMLLNNIEQLPDTTIFPGEYNFQLSLGPHTESATKSADYTYSPILKKLYVQRGAQCPFKFKTASQPPSNSCVKIMPVFKGTHVLSEPVRRCSNHAEGEDEGSPRYHFIHASSRQTHYSRSDSGRLFVTMPYTGPQVGAEYQVELLSFMCFNSCGHSSHSKRRIDVIFMLECNGHVLGRQVIEVRVCACPGRDRSNDESGSLKTGAFKTSKRGSHYGVVGKGGKRRKMSTTNAEDYTITTNNPVYYHILHKILDILESQIPAAIGDFGSLVNNTSPISSVSSPGNAINYKTMQQEFKNTDEEVLS